MTAKTLDSPASLLCCCHHSVRAQNRDERVECVLQARTLVRQGFNHGRIHGRRDYGLARNVWVVPSAAGRHANAVAVAAGAMFRHQTGQNAGVPRPIRPHAAIAVQMLWDGQDRSRQDLGCTRECWPRLA